MEAQRCVEIDESSNSGSDFAAIASLNEDWEAVMQMLPAHWQDKALELGAVRRQLRHFSDVSCVLRVLLIHLADGCSLRETSARAKAGGLADVSAVALFKRLRCCGPWFEWITQQLTAGMGQQQRQLPLKARRIRLVDGSTVSEPGATGSTWRLHYALNLQTLSCDEVHVTDASEGESLTRYEIKPGDLIMADRGYAYRGGLLHVLGHQGDVLMRMGLDKIVLHDAKHRPLQLLPLLRKLRVGQAGAWQAWLPAGPEAFMRDKRVAVRICAYKKSAGQTRATVQAIEQEARKKGARVKSQTIEAAGYVIVLTTLMEPGAQQIMEFYRRRWQVELAFKRLKSLLQLGHLKKVDEQGARAWLQGKLMVACLIESLIFTAERFSPWGYRTQTQLAQEALALA
jgi:GNAT superfamily N-acetyltransferase